MKQTLKTAILLLFAFSANAQQQGNISIGKKDSIYSAILGEKRALWIYTPDVTSPTPDTAKRCPVLFVLDGGAHFYSTVGIIQQLSQANGNGVLPEMMVVGIESTDRLKDFVPATTEGDANSFVKFLTGELMPFMEKNYNPAPYRVLVGHSLGGLLAMDILAGSPNLFNACVAIDPSMWYKDEKFLNRSIAAITKQKFANTRLFVGVANTLPTGMTVAKAKNDRTDGTTHIRAILKLDDFLKQHKVTGLKYEQKYYERENHNSVPLISEYDGLRFIFDYYHLQATEREFADSTPLIAASIKSHYATVSKAMGYKVSPPEALIQYFAYDALTKQHYEKANALFKLNTDNYPESSKVYDAYGDYFAVKRDTVSAIRYYKTAISKNGNEAIRSKLKALADPGSFILTGDVLKKYAAVYTILPYNIDIELYVKENSLWSKVPGEADEELVPVSRNIFTLKGKQGYTITFDTAGDRITGFTTVQPNGTFRGVLKR